jgi:hypothetical protein
MGITTLSPFHCSACCDSARASAQAEGVFSSGKLCVCAQHARVLIA